MIILGTHPWRGWAFSVLFLCLLITCRIGLLIPMLQMRKQKLREGCDLPKATQQVNGRARLSPRSTAHRSHPCYRHPAAKSFSFSQGTDSCLPHFLWTGFQRGLPNVCEQASKCKNTTPIRELSISQPPTRLALIKGLSVCRFTNHGLPGPII